MKEKHSFAAIQDEIKAILDMAENEDLLAEDEEKILAYLDELGTQEAEKVDGVAYVVKTLEGRVDCIAGMISTLQAKKKSLEKRVIRIKGYYLDTMIQHGLKKCQGTAFTISAVTRHVVDVFCTQEKLIEYPQDLIRITVEPRKTEIKKYLEAGNTLEGAKIIESTSLMIR